ncbi:DUF6572 domain-containing protein [Bradyrhizobium sp.]|uniref:DUF6572 domain-containing protein n=1 Tax=Bradyrhizobium sp. TaxID=376 RepID=UPI000ADB7A52|nr:DUF6572 domain-containing protein [Bradyrhizobium sp.]
MSVDQADTIDVATIDKASGELWLTISDHLPWDDNEGDHLVLLQNKLNAYLRFIESGEIFKKVPDAKGRGIVINLVGNFPLSHKADFFYGKARAVFHFFAGERTDPTAEGGEHCLHICSSPMRLSKKQKARSPLAIGRFLFDVCLT